VTEGERLVSSAVDCLTAAIEAMEAAGERDRPRRLRRAREQALSAVLGRPRRWWEVWR